MEAFWFFWLRFRRAYDSAYDSDSVVNENQSSVILLQINSHAESWEWSCEKSRVPVRNQWVLVQKNKES